MNQEITETPLTNVTSNIRAIFENDTFFGTELFDSVKSEVIIYKTPLDWQPLSRDLNLSCYHLCQENVVNDDQGFTEIRGVVYIDIMKKVKQKDLEIIFDEIDKIAWTAIKVLDKAPPDLDSNIAHWYLLNKRLYVPKSQNENDLKNNILKYICEISLNVFYSVQRVTAHYL